MSSMIIRPIIQAPILGFIGLTVTMPAIMGLRALALGMGFRLGLGPFLIQVLGILASGLEGVVLPERAVHLRGVVSGVKDVI